MKRKERKRYGREFKPEIIRLEFHSCARMQGLCDGAKGVQVVNQIYIVSFALNYSPMRYND